MEKEIGEIKLKHRGILVKHLDEIKQLHSPMLLILLALNKMMVSNEVSAVINYSCENEIKRLDIKVWAALPVLMKNKYGQVERLIYQMF